MERNNNEVSLTDISTENQSMPIKSRKADDNDMLKYLYSMMSVSYTHLDVYKRQV